METILWRLGLWRVGLTSRQWSHRKEELLYMPCSSWVSFIVHWTDTGLPWPLSCKPDLKGACILLYAELHSLRQERLWYSFIIICYTFSCPEASVHVQIHSWWSWLLEAHCPGMFKCTLLVLTSTRYSDSCKDGGKDRTRTSGGLIMYDHSWGKGKDGDP